jgi:hypothetical protein
MFTISFRLERGKSISHTPDRDCFLVSALLPSQPGEKIVQYPVRPVDTTTDFEGTTSLQPTQPVTQLFLSPCLLRNPTYSKLQIFTCSLDVKSC